MIRRAGRRVSFKQGRTGRVVVISIKDLGLKKRSPGYLMERKTLKCPTQQLALIKLPVLLNGRTGRTNRLNGHATNRRKDERTNEQTEG